jgi:hypothetical protein
MSGQSFALIPFPASNIPALSITGKVSLQDHVLEMHYSLEGSLEAVLLPGPSLRPSRKDELWQATCFELFLAIGDKSGYWEFNLSPSGDWNVYRMDAYRRIGFREESAIRGVQFEVQKQADLFRLHASVDLRTIWQPGEFLEIGIAAVVQTRDGNTTYWALTHPASQADFHRRESFILLLAGQTHPARPSAPGD